jgi:hypothetical protein
VDEVKHLERLVNIRPKKESSDEEKARLSDLRGVLNQERVKMETLKTWPANIWDLGKHWGP